MAIVDKFKMLYVFEKSGIIGEWMLCKNFHWYKLYMCVKTSSPQKWINSDTLNGGIENSFWKHHWNTKLHHPVAMYSCVAVYRWRRPDRGLRGDVNTLPRSSESVQDVPSAAVSNWQRLRLWWVHCTSRQIVSCTRAFYAFLVTEWVIN